VSDRPTLRRRHLGWALVAAVAITLLIPLPTWLAYAPPPPWPLEGALTAVATTASALAWIAGGFVGTVLTVGALFVYFDNPDAPLLPPARAPLTPSDDREGLLSVPRGGAP
jgi:hypothetical protein